MRREHANIKEFSNGNLALRFDQTMIEVAQKDDVLTLVALLESMDCYPIGETYCLNNHETGHTIYNAYSDLVYVFPWDELEELKRGKVVTLYARIPDDTDRNSIMHDDY